MVMKLNEDNIQELVEKHGQELATKELMDLYRKQQQEVMEAILFAEEEEKKAEESLTSDEIREMCKMWETVQNFVEKHHLNKAVAVWVMFNHNAVSYFHEIIKRRQKQVSLARFLIKAALKEKDSIEPINSSNSVSNSESSPTQ